MPRPDLVILPALADGRIIMPIASFPQLRDPGGGLVGRAEGVKEPIAIAREEVARFTAVVAMCTHMACILRFNQLNVSLDCPCHGSVFELDGRVVTGPAVRPLATLQTEFDGQSLAILMT
jgi:cytochrome b6-f complex iron-sulfur subunit